MGKGRNKRSRLPRICPHPHCEKQPAFGSRQALRRHFLVRMFIVHSTLWLGTDNIADIDGEGPEDCVACHEVFRRPSEIVRHIEQANDKIHNNLCKRKADYLRNTCVDLKARADDELDAWENSAGKGNKRPQVSLSSRPARRTRARLDSPVETTMNGYPSDGNSMNSKYPMRSLFQLIDTCRCNTFNAARPFAIPDPEFFVLHRRRLRFVRWLNRCLRRNITNCDAH